MAFTESALNPRSFRLVGCAFVLCLLPIAANADPTYEYNANGEIIKRIDSLGVLTAYEYDPDGYLNRIKYPDNTFAAFKRDGLGRLIEMQDPTGETQLKFDVHGRVYEVKDGNGHIVKYDYNQRDLLTELTLPNGEQVKFQWDANDMLKAVYGQSGTTRYEYNDRGMVTRRFLASGAVTSYKYDYLTRVESVTHEIGSERITHSFEYNAIGDIDRELRTTSSGEIQTTQYRYNDSRQPIAAEVSLTNVLNLGSEKTGLTVDSGPADTVRSGVLVSPDSPNRQFKILERDFEGRPSRVQRSGDIEYEMRFNALGSLSEWSTSEQSFQVVNDITGAGPIPLIVFDKRTKQYKATQLPQQGSHDSRSDFEQWSASNQFIPIQPFDSALEQVALNSAARAQSIRMRQDFTRTATKKVFKAVTKQMVASSSRVIEQSAEEFARPSNISGYSSLALGYGGLIIGRAGLATHQSLKWGKAALSTTEAIADGKYKVAFYRAYLPVATVMVSAVVTKGVGYLASLGVSNTLAAPFLASPAGLLLVVGASSVASIGVTYHLEAQQSRTELRSQWDAIAGNRHLGIKNLKERGATEKRMKSFLRSTGLSDFEMDPYLPRKTYLSAGPGGRNSRSNVELPQGHDPWHSLICTSNCAGNNIKFPSHTGVSRRHSLRSPRIGPAPNEFRPVGGVSLNGIAQVLGQLSSLQGASFDERAGELILIGEKDIRLPGMSLDALIVAVRTIYGGQEPSMSLEPCRPGLKDGCLKVMYNGRFVHPDHPELGWVRFGADGSLEQTDAPTIFSTKFGHDIFESDRDLKVKTLGSSNFDIDTKHSSDVVGFMSLLERFAKTSGQQKRKTEDACLLSAATNNTPSPCQRLWYVANKVTLRVSADGSALRFEGSQSNEKNELPIKTNARFVRFDTHGRMVDVPGNDSAVDNFVAHINENYAAFAAEKTELAELEKLARIVAVVRWLHDSGVHIDLEAFKDYVPVNVDTPLTTPAITAKEGSIAIYGGVSLDQPNSYELDAADAETLATAAKAERPTLAKSSWEFKQQERTLTAVAVPLTPAAVHGGHTIVRSDVDMDHLSPPIKVSRRYDSINTENGLFGLSWAPLTRNLSYHCVRSIISRNKCRPTFTFRGENSYDTLRQGVDGFYRSTGNQDQQRVLGFIYESKDHKADDWSFDTQPLHTGWTLSPGISGTAIQLRNAKGEVVPFRGFVVSQDDGTLMHFDTLGRVMAVRSKNHGGSISYKYENFHLKIIEHSDGDWVRVLYDDKHVQSLETSNGRTIRYSYNSSEQLSSVLNGEIETDSYDYNDAGRITKATIDGETTESEYDERGRVVRYRDAEQNDLRVSYDDRQRRILGSDGRELQLDEWGRLVAEGMNGQIVRRFEYDDSGRLTAQTDALNQTWQFSYTDQGFLRETKSPAGRWTRYYGWTERGQPTAIIDGENQVTLLEYGSDGEIDNTRTGFELEQLSENGLRYTVVDERISR